MTKQEKMPSGLSLRSQTCRSITIQDIQSEISLRYHVCLSISCLLPSFLPSFLPPVLPSFFLPPFLLPSFLPFLPSLLAYLPTYLPTHIPSFLPPFCPSFFPSILWYTELTQTYSKREVWVINSRPT